MPKTRFLSRCASYTVGVGGNRIVDIDSVRGYETEDNAEIAAIRNHGGFGNFVFEVQTKAALNKANAESAKAILTQLTGVPAAVPEGSSAELPAAIPVAPLGAVNVAEEQQKLAQEQEEIRLAEEAAKRAAEEAEAMQKAALEKKQAAMQKARDAKAIKTTAKK